MNVKQRRCRQGNNLTCSFTKYQVINESLFLIIAHEFIIDNDDKMLLYNLRFNKKHNEIITLPAPSLFDLTVGHYLVLPRAMYVHRGHTSAPEPKPEPPLDPYRPSSYQWDPKEIPSQWQYDDTPQYTRESSRGPWA